MCVFFATHLTRIIIVLQIVRAQCIKASLLISNCSALTHVKSLK